MHLITGPPASGKTHHLVSVARDATSKGERVWWIGLPSQRSYVYRRLTQAGAVLGVEFLSSQQLYYRLLAHALRLKPLVVGTGRLALVGQALSELRGELPAPGEARLFATAIAEAKRFGLKPDAVPLRDEEGQRLREIYALYERIKGQAWDYDDFRAEAYDYVQTMETPPEATTIIVDGFREVGPLELRIYKFLSQHADLYLALPEAPPDETATQTLKPRAGAQPQMYRAPNPVSEARWVLRSLKKDLAQGEEALELAVIAPQREVKAFLSLADEYGVPLMDETPKALADSLAGQLLLGLLELPDYPTASRLLAIPELNELANAALERGIAGFEAISVLAKELDLDSDWRKWLELLNVPEDELHWAQALLDTLPQLVDGLRADEAAWTTFKKQALQRAKEASSLAKGASFRAWWSALLQETQTFERPQGGVALLTHKLASGRQFKKVYLMHATEGAYSVGETEDYFLPEEARDELTNVFAKLGLPKKFLGRDTALYQELLSRADTLIVTYPEASQSGPNVPQLGLVAAENVENLPVLAAASRLELPSASRFEASVSPYDLGAISLEGLRRYDDCAFRYWAEKHVDLRGDKDRWLELLSAMREYKRINAARLEVLKGEYSEAATWLNDHADTFATLNFGESLPAERTEPGPSAYLDAATRSGGAVTLYRFVAPGMISTQEEAEKYINRRWNEQWAAAYMLERYGGRVSSVHIKLWPMFAQPLDAYDGPLTYVWRRIATKQRKASAAFKRFQTGDISPSPGFRCRECTVADVCRVAQR